MQKELGTNGEASGLWGAWRTVRTEYARQELERLYKCGLTALLRYCNEMTASGTRAVLRILAEICC